MVCDPGECAVLLPLLKEAYYSLLRGERKTSVRYKERTITYSSTSDKQMDMLRAEIMRLETKCGCAANGRKKPVGLFRRGRTRCGC